MGGAQGGRINEVICVQRVAADGANENVQVTIMGYSVISDTIGVQRAAVRGGLKK